MSALSEQPKETSALVCRDVFRIVLTSVIENLRKVINEKKKIIQQLKSVEYFCEKALSQLFESVLNKYLTLKSYPINLSVEQY